MSVQCPDLGVIAYLGMLAHDALPDKRPGRVQDLTPVLKDRSWPIAAGVSTNRIVRIVTLVQAATPHAQRPCDVSKETSMSLRSSALALITMLLAVGAATAADVAVVFSKDEIAIIQHYYSQPHANGSWQKNKHADKPLPPGIAKNLARGKPMPPGIAKQNLPDELVRNLPPVRNGYERVVVDGRVLLVEIATQLIHDVLLEAVD